MKFLLLNFLIIIHLTNDFNMIKDLIDAYDKTYSGFVDDLEVSRK